MAPVPANCREIYLVAMPRQGREEVWPQPAPESLDSRRVTFTVHDFFTPNPVEGADLY